MGCTDGDIVLLHACFKLLTDCFETNKVFESTNWNQSEEIIVAKSEIIELYAWWKTRSKENSFVARGQYEKDTEMLIRLIKVREYLWA